MRRIGIFLLMLAIPLASGQTAPEHQRHSIAQLDVGESDEISLTQERALGDRLTQPLFQDPDFIDDPILSDPIARIWHDLLRSARQQALLSPAMEQAFAWRMLLGRDTSFNAFAMPGGYLGLHLGLIASTTQADELASVLAHELSHITQRHISRGQAQSDRMTPALWGALILGAAVAGKHNALAQAALAGAPALGVQLQLNYSRDMEREADRVGYSILTGAGYAPQGFVSMFEQLQKASRLSNSQNFPYLRSHPLTTERIGAIQARIQQDPLQAPPSLRISPLAYTLVAARAKARSAQPLDYLRRWAMDTQTSAFQRQSITQRVTALVIGSHFFAQSGQSAQATALLEQLQTTVQHDAQASATATQMRADLALSQNNWQQADQLIQEPTTTRADTLLKAQAQLGLGQWAKAIDLLQVWVAQYPQDAQAWQLLSQAFEQQHQPLRQIRALAEAQLAHNDPKGALDRLTSAQGLAAQGADPTTHPVELSIIHSRIEAIQSQMHVHKPSR